MASEILNFDKKGFDRDMRAMRQQLVRITSELKRAEPHIQNTAAEVILDLYKMFLRQGVGEELTKFTKALHELGDHPPLSTLADHVIMEPSVKGRPAAIAFENTGGKDWGVIAVMHDRGYVIQADAKLRAALVAMITLKYGRTDAVLDDNTSQGGLWIVPARPHLHFFDKNSLDEKLAKVAQAIFAGKVPNLKTERPPRVEYRPPTTVQFDSVMM